MRAEAMANLRARMPRDSTVYLVLRHRSRGGMTWEIGLVVFLDGHAIHPNASVAQALGYRIGKRTGLLVKGCGRDMGSVLVRQISRALYDETQALRYEWL